jgi:hypothetical protein
MGAAADVESMVNNEGVEVVVDLRGESTESTECAYPAANVKWIQIPLADNAGQTQTEGFQNAI